MYNNRKIIITESQYKILLSEQEKSITITDEVLRGIFRDNDDDLFNKFLNKKKYKEITFPFNDYLIETPNITKLPDNMTFDGDLTLILPNLELLPENLTVNGNLHVYAPKVTKLPENIYVNNILEIIKTGILLDKKQTNSLCKEINCVGIFSKNNLNVTIEIDLIDSDSYLNVGGDYSKDIFETIFSGDFHEWYSSYEIDLKSAIDYYVNEDNEKKIEEIVQNYINKNNMEEEVDDMNLVEKIEYLDLDEIKYAIAGAETDAMNDEYQNWLIKQVISAFEEYGHVEVLSWDKIKLTVDLSDAMLNLDMDDFTRYVNSCSVDLECWFNEFKGNEIDMPSFNPDDRYIASPDKKYFNEILSDRLSEIEY